MSKRNGIPFASLILASLIVCVRAQEHPLWNDASPHQTRFVTVDENVVLEVLDWGGSGRPIVLLAGLGNTAHVFDEFAPKLTRNGHVYGITRHGYGASSVPTDGYAADRLGHDVIGVLESLNLTAPILIGHSIAGQELSYAGSRRPERVAGLVYLDALFSYSYTTPQEVRLRATMARLHKDLQTLLSRPPNPLGIPQPSDLIAHVLSTISEVQQQLSVLQLPSASPSSVQEPSAVNLDSYAALRSWFGRVRGFQWPEAEFRQQREPTSDGRVGPFRTPPFVPAAIRSGVQSFSDIGVPALALSAIPLASATPTTEADVARDTALHEARAIAFEKNVAGARVVRVPYANHYIFLSHEPDVLREIRVFVDTLKSLQLARRDLTTACSRRRPGRS